MARANAPRLPPPLPYPALVMPPWMLVLVLATAASFAPPVAGERAHR